tara:strand:+ start:347 stop:853 length:507 start_codon:yes stop_codon:yes gene_type:complete
MKYFKKITQILFLFLLYINTAYSNDSIAFIDMDFIIRNSNIGKIVLKKIEDQNNKNISILKKNDEILKDIEKNIIGKKNVISKEVFDKEVVIFREKVHNFQLEKDKIVNDFNNFKRNELENVFKKINPIINTYVEKNSIDLLLEKKNILIGRKDLNLTNKILEEINSK